MGIRDTRMMERALRERWPIPDNYRAAMIGSLLQIVADKGNSPRERTSAAKALLFADKINLEQEQLDQLDEHEQRARLVELAKHISASDAAKHASQLGIIIDAGEGTQADK